MRDLVITAIAVQSNPITKWIRQIDSAGAKLALLAPLRFRWTRAEVMGIRAEVKAEIDKGYTARKGPDRPRRGQAS